MIGKYLPDGKNLIGWRKPYYSLLPALLCIFRPCFIPPQRAPTGGLRLSRTAPNRPITNARWKRDGSADGCPKVVFAGPCLFGAMFDRQRQPFGDFGNLR